MKRLTVDDVLTRAESKGFRIDRRTRRMQCPAHQGQDLNCKVDPGANGADVVVTCHSHGCDYRDIMTALELNERNPDEQQKPRSQNRPGTPKARIVAIYDYRDETGQLVYQVVRKEPKTFVQRRPDGQGGWVWNMQGAVPLPYRLPELLASDGVVLIVEGEKDVDNLRDLGFIATCNHGGAGKWRDALSGYLRDRDVAILPDNDQPGRDHAEKVARSLAGGAASVRVVTLPGLAEKGDVSDWIAAGGTGDQLRALIDGAPRWEPDSKYTTFEHSNNSNNSNDSPEPAEPGAPYPADCLPPALWRLVEEARDTLGIPAEFTAPAGMAVIAGAIGNVLEVEIKRGWRERANVWLGVVGAPGTTKSPAIELASWPLSEIQRDLRDEWREAMVTWNETPKEQRGPTPQLEIVEVTDSTVEGLARALEHSRGVLSKADELTSWLAGHNRYRGKNASERGEHLKLWAGGNLVAVRSTRLPLIIDRPAVALIGGIQPARLAALGSDQPGVFVDDGMLDRFLIAWPDARPARWTDDEMSRETMAAWAQLVRSLRRWKPIRTDAEGERDIVRLTEPAKVLWRQWHDSNIDSIESAHGLTRGWASKAPRHLLRIALILHAGNNPGEPKYDIAAETLEAAIEITEWHRQQHGRMLSALQLGAASPAAGLPGRILRILRIAGEWVSRADLLRRLGNVKADALDRALERLVEAGTVAKRTEVTVTKPREEYVLALNNSNYSNNSTQTGTDGDELFELFESSNDTHNKHGHEPADLVRWRCVCGAKNDPITWPDACPVCGNDRATCDLARGVAA
ncbi:MAG: DUF3987 domain-containing protein [Thermomicrobiales bacterium]|nr:DUF3987 domain-containing protein [Thermomicrobiales bacterium]